MFDRMRDRARRLLSEEEGAVTVDWVVVTAAVAMLGVLVAFGVGEAATDPAEGLGTFLTELEIE